MTILKLTGVTKTYQSGPNRLDVLRQFDLELAESEFLAVVGRSGSGKTTLLNLIAGLDRADSGSILLGGRELTTLDDKGWDQVRLREIGFVFQFNQLLPEFTALENVVLPGRLGGEPLAQVEKRARDLLGHMGMSARLDHLPSQLSGGEQQRTSIARALINNPKVLLADEPTGSLDLESGENVFRLLLQLQKEFKISSIVVTHNPSLAKLCARIHTLGSTDDQELPGHPTVGV